MTDLTTLTIDELRQGREDTLSALIYSAASSPMYSHSEEMLRDIDAELACREQAAQPTAIRADDLLNPSAYAELSAENERLRALLAKCVRAIDHAQNCDFPESIRFRCEQCQHNEAVIEAAKEATNANL